MDFPYQPADEMEIRRGNNSFGETVSNVRLFSKRVSCEDEQDRKLSEPR